MNTDSRVQSTEKNLHSSPKVTRKILARQTNEATVTEMLMFDSEMSTFVRVDKGFVRWQLFCERFSTRSLLLTSPFVPGTKLSTT